MALFSWLNTRMSNKKNRVPDVTCGCWAWIRFTGYRSVVMFVIAAILPAITLCRYNLQFIYLTKYNRNHIVSTKNIATSVPIDWKHIIMWCSICLLMSPHWYGEEMTVCQAFLHTETQHVVEMAVPLCCNMWSQDVNSNRYILKMNTQEH